MKLIKPKQKNLYIPNRPPAQLNSLFSTHIAAVRRLPILFYN